MTIRNILISALFAFGVAAPAVAINHYNASEMNCDDLKAAVQRDGSAFIEGSFGGGLYIADPMACPEFYYANSAYVIAKDTWFCRVGYVCESNPHGGGR